MNKKFNEYNALINDKAPNKLCTALQQRVHELEEKLESLSVMSKNDSLSKAVYSKCLNILVHGLEENKLSAWQKRDNTLKIFEDFMKDGLVFDDLDLNSI